MNQPMGIKQNTIIKTSLGNLFKTIICMDNGMDFTGPLRVCAYIISIVYSYNTMILRDIFSLLQNKTYNPAKKRIDSISLGIDQIVLSVFLFSFSFIVYTNLVFYYTYFVLVSLALETLRLAYVCAEAVICKRDLGHVWMMFMGSVFSRRIFLKRIFTGELFRRIY